MLVDMGYIPIAPHVYFSQFMDDLNPEDRKKALEMNKKLLKFCDELWIFGDEITEGMKEEIEYFRKIRGDGKIKLTVPEDDVNVVSNNKDVLKYNGRNNQEQEDVAGIKEL